MQRIIVGLLFLLAGFVPLTAGAGELLTTRSDQTGLAVTIYNDDLALIKDQRRLDLPVGEVQLAFREVSGRLRPETALLSGSGMYVVEQNFEYDLLTPASLLDKYVGREVEVIKKHPTTGEESRETALVLSSNSGVVLKFADRIETGVPGRLAFAGVPDDLRDRPTLTMLIDNQQAGARDFELTYLSRGLSWHADYVAELNVDDSQLDLSGWVTLDNRSGATYADARLQLVAGDVHQAPADNLQMGGLHREVAMKAMAAPPMPAEEGMFEYHLYTLPRPTTIADKQSKQVALLQAAAVPCKKLFILKGSSYYYRRAYGEVDDKLKVGVFVELENRKQNHLGLPLPKGVIRVYKEDSHRSLQFVGEDRIDHTPENETIRLKLGETFDLTARRKQTSFRKLAGDSRYNYIYEAAFQIDLKNAKDEAVVIKVLEPLPGDWEIVAESQAHTKESSSIASWPVRVPAKREAQLTYRALVRF